MRRLLLLIPILITASACARHPNSGKGLNVMTQDLKGKVAYAETNCTVANPDGVRCDKKTCKADAVSDCTQFAKGCVEYGNYYQGSNDAGTCSRVY